MEEKSQGYAGTKGRIMNSVFKWLNSDNVAAFGYNEGIRWILKEEAWL